MRIVTLIAVLAAGPVLADDAALLLGTERYRALDRMVQAGAVVGAQTALTQAGFAVEQALNGDDETVSAALAGFVTDAAEAERIVVALAGRFVTDGTRNWYLTAQSAQPAVFGLNTAVSLESVMAVMARAPGQAILVLGLDAGDDDAFDAYLSEGIGDLDIPQGVTVVVGNPSVAADYLTDVLAVPGADAMAGVAENRILTAMGFVPDQLVLLPADTPITEVTAPEPVIDTAAETALWNGARALDTADAYRNYLTRYPAGTYVAEAEAFITEITTEPNRPARLAEEALGLTRDARRDIQRDLTILNFDPRGIDGIFGPGTRNAVTNWQQENGYSQTTYLTTEQINRLDAQAARRAAELEAEAARAQAEQLRLDRAYWQETGALGDEPGLRAYLERFPDGAFAGQATEALDAIEEGKRAQAAAEDNAAWDLAVDVNSADGYRTYLQLFSSGAFVEEANARISALTQPAVVISDQAVSNEQALGLNAITLRLIEARLEQLGLNPGGVDGAFDDETRRAIRNFQRDRSLDISGFLNEQTIVRLLADGLSGN